jgi:hypothetical protein
MKLSRFAGPVVLVCLSIVACSDPGRPTGPGLGSNIFVDSDTRGATIVLDGTATTRVTPDTLKGVTDADHDIGVVMTKSGVIYGATIHVTKGAIPTSLVIPVIARCTSVQCVNTSSSYVTSGTIKHGVSALGSTFLSDVTGAGGLIWPATSHNNYASIGGPVFAGVATGSTTPVALGVYTYTQSVPIPYWAGRLVNPPLFDPKATTQLTSWVVPPPPYQTLTTVRGLEVTQELTTSALVPDAIMIRVVFRNITNKPLYQALDTRVPASGITYDQAYIGFGLDPDIGQATDDYVTYAPDLNIVFAYDGDFRENTFEVDPEKPGLLGLQMLSAPANTKVVLNSWPISAANGVLLDWLPTNNNELFGYNVLARMPTILLAYTSADTRVGNVGTIAADYRMSVSAGPVKLAPGDSAVIKVAVLLASPWPGTFVTARDLPPGDPTDANRPIMKTAASLLQKARDIAAVAF